MMRLPPPLGRRLGPFPRPAAGNVVVTAAIALALLTLTGLSMAAIHRGNRQADRQHFDALRVRLTAEVKRRVDVYRYGLMGTRSAFVASEWVSHTEFGDLVASRDLGDEFPGATALGYVRRVPADELDAFLSDVRADGQPGFAVRMLADRVTADELYVNTYLEPRAGNEQAIGLDINQEATRREAAELAMRRGDVAITRPITLVQATGAGPGFLILLPHYASGRPTDTVARREDALVGWVFMTLQAGKVFAGANDAVDREIDFAVYDGAQLAPEAMLFNNHAGDENQSQSAFYAGARFHEVVPVEIGGRTWTVTMTSTPAFRAASSAGVGAAGVGGVALTVILVLLLQVQSVSLRRARGIAQAMTADLRHAAMTDRLTGLPNRAAILDKIDDALSRAGRVPGYHFAVLFLDFDRFKVINDSLGHDAGDRLLQQISVRIGRTLRGHDAAALNRDRNVAARLGGDEFIVLLDALKRPDDAEVVAERLLDALAEPFDLDQRQVRSTVSIGVVAGGSGHASAADLLRDADTAMYEAKSAGRGAYAVFDQAMRQRAKARLDIENDLQHGLERGEFFLHYQPIVRLAGGAVASFEALLRWRHPVHGVVGPDRFIPVAEETGVIVPLGRWVLNEALRQFAAWRAAGVVPKDCCLSVNLSRRQLMQPDLFQTVAAALRAADVPASRLHLEVTESQIMQDPPRAVAQFRDLRRAGVRIDLDDFGTGHSSLSCLHEFPVDVLKIDRAFVANLKDDPELVTVLRTVAGLAHDLGIQVVGEGIETTEHLNLLRSLACEYGQGYHISRPMPAEDVPGFVAGDAAVSERAA
ncbi:MAG: EAL domain-containing protein [Planctomycetota bacterium]